jgi:hypothetical protein
MVAWPFSLAWPGGLVNNQVPTHTDLNKLDAQAAQAADGTTYTDVALVSNFTQPFTDTNGGTIVLYNAFYQKFFSFRKPSADLLGYRMRPPFVARTAETIPAGAGLNPKCGDVDPVRGVMVVGGAPGSSSNLRLRVYNATGSTWSAVASAKAAGTDGPLCCIYCGGTFDRWFTGYLDGTLERSTSAPGVPSTWANVSVPNALRRDAFAFSPTLNMLLVVSQGSNKYLTSTDGSTFTERTAPTTFQTVWWSAYRGKFYAVDASTGAFNLLSSTDGINWTSFGFVLPQNFTVTQFFEYRRLVGCLTNGGTLYVSLDGLVSWEAVADFSASCGDNKGTLAFRNDSAAQLVIGEPSTGAHWASLLLGF